MRIKVSKYVPCIVCAAFTLLLVFVKSVDVIQALFYGVMCAGVFAISDCIVYMVDDVKKMFKRPNSQPVLINCEEE